MKTDDLIARMADGLAPVQVLPAPGRRAAVWALGTVAYVAVLALAVVAAKGGLPAAAGAAFWGSVAASLAAGVLASIAAFASVVPGVGQRLGWGAAVAAALWLVAAANAPVFDWSAVPSAKHEWLCVGFVVLGGAPLGAVLVGLLRRGAPLAPARTAALGALAIGAFANAGACLSLPHENGAVTVVWHGIVLLVLVGAAAAVGRQLFVWRSRLN